MVFTPKLSLERQKREQELLDQLCSDKIHMQELAGIEPDPPAVKVQNNTAGEINYDIVGIDWAQEPDQILVQTFTTTGNTIEIHDYDNVLGEMQQANTINIDGEQFTAEDVKNWKQAYDCIKTMESRLKSLETSCTNMMVNGCGCNKDKRKSTKECDEEKTCCQENKCTTLNKKCECGVDKAGAGGAHSTWCPKYIKP